MTAPVVIEEMSLEEFAAQTERAVQLGTLSVWHPDRAPQHQRSAVLTPMLRNVLESLCEGKSNRAIGRDWGISEDTVKSHLRRLLALTGARDRLHLVQLVYSGQLRVLAPADHQRGRPWRP